MARVPASVPSAPVPTRWVRPAGSSLRSWATAPPPPTRWRACPSSSPIRSSTATPAGPRAALSSARACARRACGSRSRTKADGGSTAGGIATSAAAAWPSSTPWRPTGRYPVTGPAAPSGSRSARLPHQPQKLTDLHVLGGQDEVHLGDVADVGGVAGAGRAERPDERVLHAENGVAVEVGVLRVENVRGDGPVAGRGDDGVDVRRPPVMAAGPA